MTGSSSWINKNRRLALYIRDGFCCQYCNRSLKNSPAREMGLDHLEDLVNGGGHKGANHANSNLVLACRTCNSSRRNVSYTEFAGRFEGALARIESTRHAFVNIELAKELISGAANADR
jgi:5-methylcytosine-specific restriction endonuclease McrA